MARMYGYETRMAEAYAYGYTFTYSHAESGI